MATDDKRAATANVVSIKTGKALVTADKAEVKTARLVVRKEHTPPKRQTVENPLTTEQKSELKELINEWVSCRALVKKPIAYGAAFARLYSEHLSGQVEHLYEIESCEFPGCKNWINQQIRITENINEKKASLNPEYAKSRKTTIMARCRQLGISDAIRKQYMIDRWAVDSLTKMSNSELEVFRQYVMGDNPTFQFKERANARDQALREKALITLLDKLEKDAHAQGQDFDRFALRYKKDDIFLMLKTQDNTLFSITRKTFEDFWQDKRKGICESKSGRRPNPSGRPPQAG